MQKLYLSYLLSLHSYSKIKIKFILIKQAKQLINLLCKNKFNCKLLFMYQGLKQWNDIHEYLNNRAIEPRHNISDSKNRFKSITSFEGRIYLLQNKINPCDAFYLKL